MTQKELGRVIINDEKIINQHIQIALSTIYGKHLEEKLAEPGFKAGLANNGTINVGMCDVKRGERENYAIYLNYNVRIGRKMKPRRKKLADANSVYDAIKFAVTSDFSYNLARSLEGK